MTALFDFLTSVDHVAHHLPISYSADFQRGEHFMDKYFAALHEDARRDRLRDSLERGESYANLAHNFSWVLPPFHAGASYEPRWMPALIDDDEIPALLEVDTDDDDDVPALVDPDAVPAHKDHDVPALVNRDAVPALTDRDTVLALTSYDEICRASEMACQMAGLHRRHQTDGEGPERAWAFPPTFMYSPVRLDSATSQLPQRSIIGRVQDGPSTINYIVPPTLNALAHAAQCRYLLLTARGTRAMRVHAHCDGESVERVWWRQDSSGWNYDHAILLAMDANTRLQRRMTDGEPLETAWANSTPMGHEVVPVMERQNLPWSKNHAVAQSSESGNRFQRSPWAAKLDAKLDTDSSAKLDTASSAKLKTNSSKARARCSPAQLAAMRAYRAKNQETLRAKARERMARRRQAALEGDSAQEYRARARAASQRHRERNADVLANNQRVRRAEKFIDTHGMAAWTAAYDKRYIKQHGLEAWTALLNKSAQQEPGSCTDELPSTSPDDPDHELHDFLDNHDPTTRPDYVPKPGERRYFQRGQYRWY
ncbi:hypothetical protein DFH06DRAFT_1126576 [Mycena polygramma]|nr:hypothetical protein DFH06DRAFT_1126576 [Mycena polygramma]